MKTTVLIAQPYPLDRLAFTELIQRRFCNTRTTEVADLREMTEALAGQPGVSLLILDLDIVRPAPEAGVRALLSSCPQLSIVMTSDAISGSLSNRFEALGVAGWVSKKVPEQEVFRALRNIMLGENWFPEADEPDTSSVSEALATLSAQELRILRRMSRGLMNKQIADQLSISVHTTKVHVSRILKKLGVRSRTQAVLLCRQCRSPTITDSAA